MLSTTKKGGFINIKMILIFIIGIVVLSYFGINLREILDSELVKNNFLAVWDFLLGLWKNYGEPLFSRV